MQKTTAPKNSFSQRRPFLFGLLLIMAAVILVVGIMAAFRFFFFHGRDGSSLGLSGDKLGVVNIEGLILDAGAECDWIRELRDNDKVKGVMLRVNSGGGAVAPSREMYSAVSKLAETKPVYAYFETVAASGAYYAAAPADIIVSNPSAITGSIGVIMELPNWQELFNKLGIKEQSITSGPFKAAGSPTKPMTAEEKAYLQGLVNDLHEQFVTDVAKGRGMEIETVRTLADGRAMTGARALAAGLVDSLGDYEDAMDMLREKTGSPDDITVVEGPTFESSWLSDLLDDILGNIHIHITSDLPQGPVFR